MHYTHFVEVIPKKIYAISERLAHNGFSSYLVGGSIRDLLMGNTPHDWDLATDATVDELERIFAKTISVGKKWGTIRVVFEQELFEITSMRKELDYADHRHPARIIPAKSIEEDLARRDFTINAIAYHLASDTLIDPFHGAKDIEDRCLRSVGDPFDRFHEDALRILRALRFYSSLSFSPENELIQALKEHSTLLKHISAERIRDELIKTAKGKNASEAFRLAMRTGIFSQLIPELTALQGHEQNVHHDFDIWEHSLHAIARAPKSDAHIVLALLFHDIGKPNVAEWQPSKQGYAFHQHEKHSTAITQKILQRLRFSKHDIKTILKLIELHMHYYTTSWSDSAIRRFIYRLNGLSFDKLFAVIRADCAAKRAAGLSREDENRLQHFYDRVLNEQQMQHALRICDLAINGHELKTTFELQAGPEIGKLLNHLLEAVIAKPELNSKEQLLKLARDLLESKSH